LSKMNEEEAVPKLVYVVASSMDMNAIAQVLHRTSMNDLHK
jgi:hypothetical protein